MPAWESLAFLNQLPDRLPSSPVKNVPAALGYHYGPKPNHLVANFLQNGNIFNELHKHGKSAALLNAYPQSVF